MSDNIATLQICHYSFQAAQADIAIVRETVFQQEQGVDPVLDWDGQDEQCYHLVAYIEQAPVGVARLRPIESPTQESIAKLERVAVLKPWRGQGIGHALVQEVIDFAQTQKMRAVVLHAQLPTISFYESLGFIASGEPFTEAGIEHLNMAKRLQYD